MAMSDANAIVPPAEDAKPSMLQKSYERAPVTPTMDNGPQEKPIRQKRYKYRWQITFPAPEDEDVIPRKKFATFLSMIGQFWPSTVLNAWANKDTSQGLTNSKDLPYLRND
eukprot:2702277-Ditylum_brightwellii.AAC.1